MAYNRLTIEGYGQIELNNVAFRRDGRIEAQCKPNSTDFANAKVENGMILAVDGANRTVGFSKNDTDIVALVYSTEHIYDERTPGLKNFALNGTDDFLPRLGYLAVGDKFTTNCVGYDTTDYATEEALKTALKAYKTTAVYGGKAADGSIKLQKTAPTVGPVLKVIEYTTMPDGTDGVKLQVLTA